MSEKKHLTINVPTSLAHVYDAKQRLSDVATILIHVPEHKQYAPKLSASTCNEVWARENEPVARLTRLIATIGERESADVYYQIEGMFSLKHSRHPSSNQITF